MMRGRFLLVGTAAPLSIVICAVAIPNALR